MRVGRVSCSWLEPAEVCDSIPQKAVIALTDQWKSKSHSPDNCETEFQWVNSLLHQTDKSCFLDYPEIVWKHPSRTFPLLYWVIRLLFSFPSIPFHSPHSLFAFQVLYFSSCFSVAGNHHSSYLEPFLEFCFRFLLTSITLGIWERKQLLKLTQHPRLRTRGELVPVEYEVRQVRGNRVGGTVTREDMGGWWDTCVNQCVVPQLPEARGSLQAVSLGNSVVLKIGECHHYR